MAQIVEQAGVPEVHLAWVAPAEDPALQRASRQHRVVTIHQRTRGSKKDFATVGLEPERHAQYLIFPRSLRQFQGARIVGIHYEALQGGHVSMGPLPPAPAKPKRSRGAAPQPPNRREDNLIRFRPPTEVPPAAVRAGRVKPTQDQPRRSPRARPSAAPASAPVSAIMGPEHAASVARPLQDPVLRAVRHALEDLKAGRLGSARTRLERLVAGA